MDVGQGVSCWVIDFQDALLLFFIPIFLSQLSSLHFPLDDFDNCHFFFSIWYSVVSC